MRGPNIVDVSHVPRLAEIVKGVGTDHCRVNPAVIAGLLTMLPTECGSDGALYRRRRAAEHSAEGYQHAVEVLRPGTRFYWLVVPDGRGWRWWGVLLPRAEAE